MKILFVIMLIVSTSAMAEKFDSKEIEQWQIAPMSTLGSFAREGDMFYEMPVDGDYYYDVPYHRNPESGDLAFGTKKSISGNGKTFFKGTRFEQRKWAEIEVFENKTNLCRILGL